MQSFSQAANGTVVENPDGTLNYTPNAGFVGADSFTYTVSDGTVGDAASVNVTVSGLLSCPVIQNSTTNQI